MALTRRATVGGLAAAAVVGPARAALPSVWDRVSTTKVLRVGLIPNRPPYQWRLGEEQEGLAIQMGKDVATALGAAMGGVVRIEYVTTTWGTLVLDIQSGAIDVFFGMVDSEERRRAIGMFGPVYSVPVIAVNTRGFAPGDTWAAYDQPSTRIATVIGTADDAAARQLLPKATLISFKSLVDAVLAVQAGNASALVTSILIGLDAQRKNPGFANITLLQPVQAFPSGGGTPLDADGRMRVFLQGWAEQYRASGRAQAVIMESIAKAGLPTEKLPADVRF